LPSKFAQRSTPGSLNDLHSSLLKLAGFWQAVDPQYYLILRFLVHSPAQALDRGIVTLSVDRLSKHLKGRQFCLPHRGTNFGLHNASVEIAEAPALGAILTLMDAELLFRHSTQATLRRDSSNAEQGHGCWQLYQLLYQQTG
jgi:hypothetical protein